MTDSTPTTPGTDVATFDPTTSKYAALFEQDGEGGIAELISENFGDEGFDVTLLDRLTVPSGGMTSWEIPDEDPVKKWLGVIVHKARTRSFWFKKRGEDGEEDGPPDCYSDDGVIGLGRFGKGSADNPTGECEGCPMNTFGSSTSGSGNGKACKEQIQLFVLRPDAVLPTQVSLPPTSLKNWSRYVTRLTSKKLSFYKVVTAFTLEKATSGGQTYSVVVPSMESVLDPSEGREARSFGHTIRGLLENAAAKRRSMVELEAEGAKAPSRSTYDPEAEEAAAAAAADAKGSKAGRS